MIENHPQEALLIRFADGHTTPEEIQQVRELISRDQSAALFLKQLDATHDWLNKFASMELEDPPRNTDSYVHTNQTHGAPRKKNTLSRLAFVATLALGLIGGALLTTSFQTNDLQLLPNQASAGSPPEWVRLVVDYHRLYGRETVQDVDIPVAKAVSAQLSTTLGRDAVVPDLTGFNMQFRRKQRLVFDNKPIIQLVYLPEYSHPIAVCIFSSKDAAESKIISGTQADMQYAYWQNNEHAVVIVGHASTPQLHAVIKEVEATIFSPT